MFRPEGWENPFSEGGRMSRVVNADVKEYGFEAGADAECDGIIKKIESMPHGTTHCDILRVLRGGDES